MFMVTMNRHVSKPSLLLGVAHSCLKMASKVRHSLMEMMRVMLPSPNMLLHHLLHSLLWPTFNMCLWVYKNIQYVSVACFVLTNIKKMLVQYARYFRKVNIVLLYGTWIWYIIYYCVVHNYSKLSISVWYMECYCMVHRYCTLSITLW